MATIARRAIQVAKTVHGNSPWTQEFQEAASQTFLTGAIVTLDGSGRVVEAGVDPARILGVAAGNAHNDLVTGTSKILVWIADDETIFVGNLSGSSITALTDVGAGYGVVKDTTAPGGDVWEVDKTDIANKRVIVVDLDTRDNIGDTNGRVLFMFFAQYRILSYTS